MNPLEPFKPPKRPPTKRSHLERMVEAYAREHTIPQARVRRLISLLALIGALQRITDERDDSRFLVKGGVAMELRLGLEARSTQDFDVVFRGAVADLRDLIDDLAPVRGACVEVFDNRATHAWSPELIVPDSWKAPYEADAKELLFAPTDIDQAASDVRAFIARIDDAASSPS